MTRRRDGEPQVLVLMGVAGSGKTTTGRQLAADLGWRFYDADDFHSAANIEKMRRGLPLNDDDRRPWLEALRALVQSCLARGQRAIIACSALRASYRKYLLLDERVRLVYLKGDYALIQARLQQRQGHFLKPELLDSQFATLEEPTEGLTLDVAAAPEELAKTIRERLGIKAHKV
ncbi:MAG TPA: gluconokinase [Pyrinomonadaceae bacterium]|jgi:gluconokinase